MTQALYAHMNNKTVKKKKEEIQMAKKPMKKCSPSLAIKEMQIKITLRFHLTSVKIAIIENTGENPHTLLVGM
jgi:hypothetical protein